MNRSPFPWIVVVLCSSAPALAQVTVGDDPLPASPGGRQGSHARSSIRISGEGGGRAVVVPEFHTVQRGDTLWDITGYYFSSPWLWPQVWGLNPQITNPHWIFPGDQVRLATGGTAARPSTNISSGTSSPLRTVPPETVFLRDEGWLDPRQAESAGTIAGSPEDHMLLAEGDQVYVDFPRTQPHVGEEYTIYQEAQSARGGDRQNGRVVRIIGTAVVDAWDRDHHLATARITEAIDPIERGERVAAIPRRINVVPPRTNEAEVHASIVATITPRTLVGQNMVVFIDRGSDDKVEKGNRFQVLRRGDSWRQSLTISAEDASGSGIDRDGDGNADPPPGHGASNDRLPQEVVGEIQVIDVKEKSATCIVTSSVVDLQIGDLVEMRKGY